MPANSGNGNGNGNGQNNGRNQGSSIPGDILGQLAANTATTKDTYLLEKAMSMSLSKIEKYNSTANTILTDIRKSVTHSDTTLTSIDNTLNKMSKRLDEIAQSLKNNTTLHPNTGSTVSTVKIESQLSDIIDILRNPPPPAGGNNGNAGNNGPTPQDSATSADTLDDINDTLLQLLAAAKDSRDFLEDIAGNTAVTATIIYEDYKDRSSNSSRRRGSENNNKDEDKEKNTPKKLLDLINTVTSGVKEGESITGRLYTETGAIFGDVLGGVVSAALSGIPILGDVIGSIIDNGITGMTKALGELVSYITEMSRKTRDEIMKAGFEKISKDVKAMSTYSLEIYEKATDKLYSAWDQNLSQVTATQGYTKEALNTLQDAVAQRLQAEGYSNVINAGDYITQLTNTLNAKLGGELAEAFAAQNLILQKAVPEVDLSSMAADFAAIYTNAVKQGTSGEETMIDAMNQIVGATKALEETTNGNNQFINQIGTFLKKAEEVVNRSGGTADQIASLTTQMMAAEAPLSALVPQLSGFTSDLVDKLMSGNDSTAVALRAIMNSIDSSIGVSATSFMESFMEDTQGTLATAYKAIDQFISNNANADAQQEFYKAMETMFGITASQLAQIDFGEISVAISEATTAANMAALTDAENLLKSGETTTYEEQLVANTTNQLLATNSIADTLDNALMRKLEKNEIEMERQVYALEADLSVNLAQNTLGFFTKVFDVLGAMLDPLGIFKGLSGLADADASAKLDKEMYVTTMTMDRIGSAVADAAYADRQTQANAWSTAMALEDQNMKDTIKSATEILAAANPITSLVNQLTGAYSSENRGTDALRQIVEEQGTTTTLNTLLTNQQAAAYTAEQSSSEIINVLEDQVRTTDEYQEKLAKANEASETYEARRQAALEAQQAQYAQEAAYTQDNHDNIESIKMSIDTLNTMSNDIASILQENRQQNTSLDEIKGFLGEVVDAIKRIGTTQGTPQFQSTIAYDEATRITKNGYMSPSIFSMG